MNIRYIFYISQQIRICSAPSTVCAAYYHMRSHTVNGYLTYIYDSTANRDLIRCTRCVCCILLRSLSCCTAVLLLGVCGVMISRCFRCLPFAVRSTDLTKPRQIVRCTVQDAHFIRIYLIYEYGISIYLRVAVKYQYPRPFIVSTVTTALPLVLVVSPAFSSNDGRSTQCL